MVADLTSFSDTKILRGNSLETTSSWIVVRLQLIACAFLLFSPVLARGQVSFFTPPTYSPGGQMLVADFNGDGKPDMLSSGGELLLGKGDGTFASGTPVAGGELAVADFNGDGRPDVLQQGPGTLMVLLGNGDGTFQPPISTNSNANLTLIVAGDLNGDGKADVLGVFNSSLLVYLSNGDGTFAAASSYDLGSLPASGLVLGDFNGDHRTDLAVFTQTYNAPGQVIVFLGNGDGSLQSARLSDGVISPGGPVAGDFNTDGNLDLVVVGQGGVWILLGNGDGTFQEPTVAFAGGGNLTVCDLRGQGKLDLLVHSYPMVEIYAGNGDGTFSNTHSYMNHVPDQDTGAAAVGDFNLDGKLDVASGNSVLLGNGDGTLRGQPAVPVGVAGEEVSLPAMGDFNGDGFADFAVISQSPAHGFTDVVNILLNDGTGALVLSTAYTLPQTTGATSTLATDVNRDGKPDLVIIGRALDGTSDWILFVLLGKGDGSFDSPLGYPLGTTQDSGAVIAADFNHDQKPDLALPQSDGTMAVLLGNGDGTFGAPMFFYDAGAVALVATDLNGDGNVDVAAGAGVGLRTALLLGNGDGTFQAADLSLGAYSAFLAADFNGDSRTDLMGRVNSGFQVLLGNGDGTYHALSPFASLEQVLLAKDINTDGTLDLIGYDDGRVPDLGVSLGTGDGNFGPFIEIVSSFENDFFPIFAQSVDMNQDGKMDLVIGEDSSTPGVYVLLNTTNPIPAASLSPSSLSFPSQVVGTHSEPMPVTLTNPGAVALTVTGVSISGADANQFSQMNNCTVVQPTTSCTIQVTFSPTSEGSFGANLLVTDDAAGSPQSVSLSGTGASSDNIGLSIPTGGSSSQTVSAGGTATYTLSIGGTGWGGDATLSCSGAPRGANCSVTPANLTVSATSPAQLTVNVTTTARAMAGLTQSLPTSWLWATGIVGFALLPGSRKRKHFRSRVLRGMATLLLVLLCGCGGGGSSQQNSNGTPAGTYTLTVTASGGSLNQSVPLTLKVQ